MLDYGYARMSLSTQPADAKARALREAGCAQVYTDLGVSGTVIGPRLADALHTLDEGDRLVVCTQADLGRDGATLFNVCCAIADRGAELRILTVPELSLIMAGVLAARLCEREMGMIPELALQTRKGSAYYDEVLLLLSVADRGPVARPIH